MQRMIVFDDGRGRFGPMADLRAAFEIRTGMLTTAGRIALTWPGALAGYWAQPAVRDVVAERANAPVSELPGDEETYFCVNGRWSLPDSSVAPGVDEAFIESETEDVIAATFRRADAAYFFSTGELPERTRTKKHHERVLYRYPWDVISLLWKTIPYDILHMRLLDAKVPGSSVTTVGEHPIEVHQTSSIWPRVILDATLGPIMIHERAVIRPGAILCGPCSVGYDSTVIDRALIKPNTVIGPNCKVGGEVGGTIFQGYSNKSHDGHLGDSWVGKWVNFGAGTTNSNLLNTYGEVPMRIEPDGARQRTGLTFLGAIVGDHTKFAINTRMMTGSVFGTGTMVATTSPPPVTTRRFAWLTDEGERAFQLEKFIEVMTTVMARRRKTPGEAYIAAVRALYERYVTKHNH